MEENNQNGICKTIGKPITSTSRSFPRLMDSRFACIEVLPTSIHVFEILIQKLEITN